MLGTLPLIFQDKLEIIPLPKYINLPNSLDFTLLILIGKIFIIQDASGIKCICEAILLTAFHAHSAQPCRENTLAQTLSKQHGTISIYIVQRGDKQYPQGVLICNSLWLRLSIFSIGFRETYISFSVNGPIVSVGHSPVGLFFFFLLIWGNSLGKLTYELEIFSHNFILFLLLLLVFLLFSFWVMQKNF